MPHPLCPLLAQWAAGSHLRESSAVTVEERLLPVSARQPVALQMFRAELARAVGVTAQAIGYHEAGDRRPDMSLQLRLAEVLQQPVGFFLRRTSVSPKYIGARFFRSVGPKNNKTNHALSVRTSWLFELVCFLSRFVRLPTVNLPVEIAPPQHGRYSLSEIEEIATGVRRHWTLGDGPIANMVALLETHGVIGARFEIGAEKIDAFSAWIDGRPYVFLGSDKGSCVRSRFDAAHQLGHLILHADISQEDLESEEIRDRIKKEANWFI
ncbi:XRE family transcriptional regulator [uncultured Paracoccus sp.]|uniref:XRE family transcriptional regulator n=1 Tax=uncultured Paracoccus sp. TaxID=189685 RepID=UPI0026240C7C|nr:XRE family transcriptional regulator [uncultured Paracoccus sp.]